jgi:diguanylate cyclase (GGDEF)-like protein
MTTVLTALFYHHDLRLVALAAVICGLSSFGGMTLLSHARKTSGMPRRIWLAVAAVAVGFGIWTTHFIGMLAFSAGMPTGYDIPKTLLSLAVAILLTGVGFWLAASGGRRSDATLGGAIAGLGIGCMHYLGMSALLIGGDIAWDPVLVSSSILLGLGLGALAVRVGTEGPETKWRLAGAGILTVGICAMHFTGMGAVDFSRCFPIVGGSETTPASLSIAVALISTLILLAAFGAIYLDLRERRRDETELARMSALADAAVEGLVIASGDTIVTVNASFRRLAGGPPSMGGRSLLDFFDARVLAAFAQNPSAAVETTLRSAEANSTPVEIIVRELDYGGKPHRVIAVRDLTDRKRSEEHIRFLAHHDVLTGLANRASFNARLDIEIGDAARLQQTLAVLSVDLDRFKEINDNFGHAAGDALLRRVAQALVAALGETAFIARLGGDEFSAIIPDIRSLTHVGHLADRVIDAFAAGNALSREAGLISASIGIAIYPDNAIDAQSLLSNADTALYRAKHDGRGVYRYFESQMGAEVRDRRLLENDLRQAISRNELRLEYQPQCDMQSGEIVGFEALTRWHHPTRGLVPPSVFIPLAEGAGLIAQIDTWVLRTACTTAALWDKKLGIAVNVSAMQVENEDLPQLVVDTLASTGLAPHRLELEVTESALMRDMNRALANLRQIKVLGVRIAMDDFGTGYSSLANLRAFPFDRIKIDQSFVKSVDSNEQSAAIVRAVVSLGAALGLPVIAEGVERIEELEFLRRENCTEAQGFFIGRPADISSFGAVTDAEPAVIDPISSVA